MTGSTEVASGEKECAVTFFESFHDGHGNFFKYISFVQVLHVAYGSVQPVVRAEIPIRVSDRSLELQYSEK